jgi:hypothetical protein
VCDKLRSFIVCRSIVNDAATVCMCAGGVLQGLILTSHISPVASCQLTAEAHSSCVAGPVYQTTLNWAYAMHVSTQMLFVESNPCWPAVLGACWVESVSTPLRFAVAFRAQTAR